MCLEQVSKAAGDALVIAHTINAGTTTQQIVLGNPLALINTLIDQ
jgi:hypothetical protein